MFETIVQKTLRVPRVDAPAGDGSAVARQLDAALLQVGFSASRELLEHVSGKEPGSAMDYALRTLVAVRTLIGDHVAHNAYFIDFPRNVPDTLEFWVSCLRDALVPVGALASGVGADELRGIVTSPGFNLLTLPTYGSYQHTYADLLAAHDELVRSTGDRVTVLTLGGPLDEESAALFHTLAGSTVPLGEADLALLAELAGSMAGHMQPREVPVRENRAVINAAYLAAGLSLVAVDTVTDVLRLACSVSDGDVSLQTPTKFRNFTRRERRVLLSALDRVISDEPRKLADALKHAERWKRLSKALHPVDYPQYLFAAEVFAVARGERPLVRSTSSRFETALRAGDREEAVRVLSLAPGMLLRSVDRLLRGATDEEMRAVLEAVREVVPSVSGRVLLSLREHLTNRATPDAARVFVGRSKRAWVTPDERLPLPLEVIERLSGVLDLELLSRMPSLERLVVDPSVFDVSLPLSGKASEEGFAVLPRGSRMRLDPAQGDSLRFFVSWKERAQRTDFDLSAVLLNEKFEFVGQVSYTSLRHGEVLHSGDITSAPNGASEFIEVPLARIDKNARYIVPQVNIYSGEGFDEVEESMFGYMLRDREQRGMPFEPRTVRTRSDMRGSGRVALPVMFERDDKGGWTAVWTHLYLRGHAAFNQVEGNRLSASLLARSVVERGYLTVGYLVYLLATRAGAMSVWDPAVKLDAPVTFIGLARPMDLPEGSKFYAADQLTELIPG